MGPGLFSPPPPSNIMCWHAVHGFTGSASCFWSSPKLNPQSMHLLQWCSCVGFTERLQQVYSKFIQVNSIGCCFPCICYTSQVCGWEFWHTRCKATWYALLTWVNPGPPPVPPENAYNLPQSVSCIIIVYTITLKHRVQFPKWVTFLPIRLPTQVIWF